MRKVTIEVELSEHLFHAYECEARRCGKRLDQLVARVVNVLIQEMEREISNPPPYFS